MDHFNSTIRDGELVNTRRGLQVSRQKFNGLSFVNAYPQSSGPTSGSSSRPTASADKAKAPQRQFKFVDTPGVSRQGIPRSQRQDTESPSLSEFPSDASHGKKPRRRMTTKDPSSTASPAPSSRRSSHASSNASSVGESSYRSQTPKSQDASSIDLATSQTAGSSAWPSLEPPADMSEENWKLFHRHFATLPSKIYPLEDILAYNPARTNEFYEMHVKDAAAFQIVLMCGSVATSIVNGDRNPKGLGYYISVICSILNRKLDQKRAVDHVTLLCITALAASACYVGRLDHWHMHMRGLRKALDVNGGLDGLPVWLLNKIHLTDLEGTTALACSPYLEYTKKFDPVSNALPLPLRNHIRSSLSTLLTPLYIDPAVINAVSSLSVFTSSIGFAKNSSGAVTFDPHAFTDEWLSVRHSLATQTGPLQNQPAFGGAHSIFNPYDIPEADTMRRGSSTSSTGRSELYMGSHQLRSDVPIIPTELGPGGPLEPALRIAGLLYLKELIPNWPRNFGGYAVLLKLLGGHMTTLLGNLAGGGDGRQPAGDILGGDQGGQQYVNDSTSTKGSKGKIVKSKKGGNISYNQGSTAAGNKKFLGKNPASTTSTIPPYGQSGIANMRPLILWICLIGDMISRIADENEGRGRQHPQDDDDDDENTDGHDDGGLYPRGIYGDCLREIVGVRTSQDVDDLLGNQEDLVMFGLFDPGMIYRRCALIVKPQHVLLLTGGSDDAGVGGGSEDWMEVDAMGEIQHQHRGQGEGMGSEAGGGWDLRGALMGMLELV